jgi:hypothetical protein
LFSVRLVVRGELLLDLLLVGELREKEEEKKREKESVVS